MSRRWLRRLIKFAIRRLARLTEFARGPGIQRPGETMRSILGDLALPGLDHAQSQAVDFYLQHFFCVFGSGWLPVIDASPNDTVDPTIAHLIDAGYRPIDWHADFKSGHRWPRTAWFERIAMVGIPGVDVKVPWELARMQHLALLARAAGDSARDAESRERCAREVRNQILDFVAHNPVRRGVNWASPMDVAIRAVNWIVAIELCRIQQISFDQPFHDALAASLRAHARHVSENLEWTPEFRGNHFFASVLGVLFVARYLPADPESEAWLVWGAHQLRTETIAQFNSDGSNIEASTAYHRLTAEMALLGTALVLGFDADDLIKATRCIGTVSSLTGRIRLSIAATGASTPDSAAFLGHGHFERLERMAAFSIGVTKPDERAVLIGDNDSGRILKVNPQFEVMTVAQARRKYKNLQGYRARSEQCLHLEEDLSTHGELVAGINAVLGRSALDAVVEGGLAGMVSSLARTRRVEVYTGSAQRIADDIGDELTWTRHLSLAARAPRELCEELVIDVPGGVPTLVRFAFPDFGLFVLRARDFYLSVRCAVRPGKGLGAHAHNDQLAVELQIAGRDVLADPGSYCYTPFPQLRDAYRSCTAHSGPRAPGREPGSLGEGMFRLIDRSDSRCLYFGEHGFVGTHIGFGATVCRLVEAAVGSSRLRIVDFFTDAGVARKIGLTLARTPPQVPFSPGYGVACRAR